MLKGKGVVHLMIREQACGCGQQERVLHLLVYSSIREVIFGEFRENSNHSLSIIQLSYSGTAI